MDLVVWGHEHECMIAPGQDAIVDVKDTTFSVIQVSHAVTNGSARRRLVAKGHTRLHTLLHLTQPGSTVPTELSEAEAKPKHCAILHLHHTNWKLTSIPLQTARRRPPPSRYIPLHTVTYRYISLHTVTYRYLPPR